MSRPSPCMPLAACLPARRSARAIPRACRTVLGIATLIVMLMAWPGARGAHAQQAEEAFAALSSTSFNTIRQGVETLVASGHPPAVAVIVALQSGRLFVRGD